MHLLFGIAGADPVYDLDVGDHSIAHDRDQIPESCRAWVAVQAHAGVSTSAASLVVASPDAPLVQPNGIQTDRATRPGGSDPMLAFWLLNNHWDVNFAASQGARRLAYRFRLAFPQAHDPIAARAFGQAAVTAPVIVRAYDAAPFEPRPVLEAGDPALVVRLRRAEKQDGLVLTVVNPTAEERNARIRLSQARIASARQVSVVEMPLGPVVRSENDGLTLESPAGSSRHYLLTIA
jgi:alpha-mannosidase